MIRGLWLCEIYRSLFEKKDGFASQFLSQGLSMFGIMIFRVATIADGSFITSDNPVVFQKMSITTELCPNGIYFPLTPRFLLFLGKRSERAINNVIFRTVRSDDVKRINRVILNGAKKPLYQQTNTSAIFFKILLEVEPASKRSGFSYAQNSKRSIE